LQNEQNVDFMIQRNGAWNASLHGNPLLTPGIVAEFKKSWSGYRGDQLLSEVYGPITALLPSAEGSAELDAHPASFNPMPMGPSERVDLEQAVPVETSPENAPPHSSTEVRHTTAVTKTPLNLTLNVLFHSVQSIKGEETVQSIKGEETSASFAQQTP
jgi:hypothetical protein